MDIQAMGERMRSLAVVLAGAALIAGTALTPSANAQSQSEESRSAQGMPLSQMIDRRVAMLTSHLQLYSGQVRKIRAILTQEQEQLATLRNNVSDSSRPDRAGPGPRSVRSAPAPELRVILDRTEREIEQVLSAKQLAAYRALKEGRSFQNYLPQVRRGGFSV
jgi:hypothetical protein